MRHLIGHLRRPSYQLRSLLSSSSFSPSTEVYERLTPVEHVLRRPGMYIGSVSEQHQPLWLYEGDGSTGKMVWRHASYIPGLYKIFDELLVNALDNQQVCER